MTNDYGRPTEAQITAYRFDLAALKRLTRTQAETESLYRRLARQRIRFILGRLVRR